MMDFRTLLLSLLLSATPLAQPAQVILLRHAEKPDDEAAMHLSALGEQRAKALAEFFCRSNALTSNAPIAALYATRPARDGAGQRPGETLAPLGQALSLPVQTPYRSDDFERLARLVTGRADYRGKTVLVCWTHGYLPELAEAFGVKTKVRKWKDRVYDRYWVIRFVDGQARLTDVPQRLLKGDSDASPGSPGR